MSLSKHARTPPRAVLILMLSACAMSNVWAQESETLDTSLKFDYPYSDRLELRLRYEDRPEVESVIPQLSDGDGSHGASPSDMNEEFGIEYGGHYADGGMVRIDPPTLDLDAGPTDEEVESVIPQLSYQYGSTPESDSPSVGGDVEPSYFDIQYPYRDRFEIRARYDQSPEIDSVIPELAHDYGYQDAETDFIEPPTIEFIDETDDNGIESVIPQLAPYGGVEYTPESHSGDASDRREEFRIEYRGGYESGGSVRIDPPTLDLGADADTADTESIIPQLFNYGAHAPPIWSSDDTD
ncbi:MAG: hypothetical protein O7G86_20470 [Gammaproteobacteria bacterium]|nr:hypothetical protein [Gammaproteobacteria bacterium]